MTRIVEFTYSELGVAMYVDGVLVSDGELHRDTIHRIMGIEEVHEDDPYGREDENWMQPVVLRYKKSSE